MSLPVYQITLDDNTSYTTAMAASVTLIEARAYFMGQVQVSEDFETGKETRRRVVAVDQVCPECSRNEAEGHYLGCPDNDEVYWPGTLQPVR